MSVTTNIFIRKEISKRFDDIKNNIRGVSQLPKDVIIHHLSDDGSNGPRYNSTMVKDLLDANEFVYVYNIVELNDEDLYGRIALTGEMRSVDRDYFTKNRHFSKVHKLERILDRGTSPIIFNYNHIHHVYKSPRNMAIDGIYRNMGNFATLWGHVVAIESDAVQLITIRLPRIVSGISDMRELVKKPNKTNLLKYASLQDMYLFSLMTIIYADEYSETMSKRHVVFRIVDGINHVDIPYWLIAAEIDKKSSTPISRLTDLYEIIDSLIELRVSSSEEAAAPHELKASTIKVDVEDTDILDTKANISRMSAELLASGVISEAEVKKAERDMLKFEKIELDGKSIKTILEESKKNPRAVPKSTIPKLNIPIDDSLKSNVVQEMDKEYVTTTLHQDFIENLATLSNSGHMVIGIKKETHRDAASEEAVYNVQTRHINGSVGTLKIVIPAVKTNGTFRSGGVNYRMGRQRMTLPIVKIKTNDVAMTASHSKMFAVTGRTASDNIHVKLSKAINNHIIDGTIVKYTEGKSIPPNTKMGLIEGGLFASYSSLVYKGLSLDFVGGHTYKGDPVKFTDVGDIKGAVNYGNVLTLLDIPADKMGLPFSELKVKGAHTPISAILSSWMGLSEFFKLIGVITEEYDLGKRIDKSKGPIIRFKDVKIQIIYRNTEQMLLVNGLRKLESSLREVERDSLDKPAGWRIIFTIMGLGRSQERGLANIKNTWIDAITAKLLKRQGYPTDMVQLLLAVNKLLSTAEYERESDGDTMFIRGYDRINDLIYRELMVGVAEFESNPSSKRKLTINPRAVKLAILSDGLVSPTEDTSPINQISNQTRLGYGGTNGRGDRSMTAANRVYDANDLGVISEAGTDDGKTGTILNTPMNPNFDSIYGTSSKDKDLDIGNILSVNSVVAPFALHDELKRTIFSRIQSNSMIYAEGYRIMPVYTGAGITVPHQVDGNYAHISKQDGVVRKITDKYMEVKYKDGTIDKLGLGRGFSRNSGKILPKKLITDMSPKDTFRQGAVLIWDTNYFARSMVEPDQADLYTGAPIFVAIKDEMDVYEDASAIDKLEGETTMSSNIIHTRALSIPYTSNFKLLVKVGDTVEPSTPCAVIAPEGVELTDDITSLDFMSQVSPKIKHGGHIVRIEVNYMGDKKGASKGILKAINESDKQFKEESEYLDVHPTGEVSEPTFISQEYLEKDSAVITIYVEHLDKYTVGDKSSNCNALKTVNGYAWSGRIETLSGIKVGEKFSGDGIFRRIVTSSFPMGLLNLCQYTAGTRLSDIYHGRM